MKNIFAIHHYDSSRLMHSSKLEGLELAGFARRFFALVIDYNRRTVHTHCIIPYNHQPYASNT